MDLIFHLVINLLCKKKSIIENYSLLIIWWLILSNVKKSNCELNEFYKYLKKINFRSFLLHVNFNRKLAGKQDFCEKSKRKGKSISFCPWTFIYTFRPWMERNSNSPFQRNEIDCKSWHCWGKGEKNASSSSGKESRASRVCTYISAHVQGVSFWTWTSDIRKIKKFHTHRHPIIRFE